MRKGPLIVYGDESAAVK
jgi:large subunit ribosomal protein L4e